MCLITFAYKSHSKYSLILLANRDEFYQRPTQAMHYWPDQEGTIAGRDLEQMGTWLGINTQGKFSAVTNYRDGNTINATKRSRGELTASYLATTATANDYLAQLEENKTLYGDFNLLLGDNSGLYYCSNRGGLTQALSPGVYGMSNALLNTPWPKLTQVNKALEEAIRSEKLNLAQLLAIMQNQQRAPDSQLPDTGISLEWERLLSSSFISSETYGTRAITILLQQYDGATQLIEQVYDRNGKTGESEYTLTLPAIGSDQP